MAKNKFLLPLFLMIYCFADSDSALAFECSSFYDQNRMDSKLMNHLISEMEYLNDPLIWKNFEHPSFVEKILAYGDPVIFDGKVTVNGSNSRLIGSISAGERVVIQYQTSSGTITDIGNLSVESGKSLNFKPSSIEFKSLTKYPSNYISLNVRDIFKIMAIPKNNNLPIDKALQVRNRLLKNDIDWKHEYRLLRYRLAYKDVLIQNLLLDPSTILSVDNPIHKNSIETLGIYVVNTKLGKKVIKIISNSFQQKKSYDQAVYQLHLGELGVSIPVSGILDKKGIQEIYSRFPHMNHSKQNQYLSADWAIVMDWIPEGWNPKPEGNRLDRIPEIPWFAKNWDSKKIIARLDRVDEVMYRLAIADIDLQYLFSKSGRPYVFDLAYAQTSSEDAINKRSSMNISEVIKNAHYLFRTRLQMRLDSSKANLRKDNFFFQESILEGFSTEELQWLALETISKNNILSSDLRNAAQNKISYFKFTENLSKFTLQAQVFSSIQVPTFQQLPTAKEAIEFALLTFTNPYYDSQFRELLSHVKTP